MPSITLSGLTATTPDGRTLFSNLDLSFDGGRTGLVGRNGVGKTTLLGIMAGMLSPQAGTVSTTGTLGVLRQTVQVAADEALAIFGKRDDRRRGAAAFSVLNDRRFAAFKNGHTRVGGTEIDSDYATHKG